MNGLLHFMSWSRLLRFILVGLLVCIIYFYWSYDDTSINNLLKDNKLAGSGEPFFHRFPEAADLPCASFFAKNGTNSTGLRLPVNLDKFTFNTTCNSIRNRHYFPKIPVLYQEAEFPLAFARNVYKDYLFVESELATIYAPQNSYCYSIDSDADERFKSRMHALSNCFDNVFITPEEFSLNSDGHDMDRAHLACLEILRNKAWKYVALLQNHDAVIKTNAELVQIYTWFNGANDVGTCQMTPNVYNTKLDWSFSALKLFKNTSKNTNQRLSFSKGLNQCSLSRTAVDYVFEELDLTRLVNNLNINEVGSDEILFSTLNSDDAIGLPGGFTHKCLNRNIAIKALTRNQHWEPEAKKCPSGKSRHEICLIGVEFLSEFDKWPAMFANKVYPEFDYGGYECLRERLFNRTYSADRVLPTKFLNEVEYTNFLPVRFHNEKQNPEFSLEDFQCK